VLRAMPLLIIMIVVVAAIIAIKVWFKVGAAIGSKEGTIDLVLFDDVRVSSMKESRAPEILWGRGDTNLVVTEATGVSPLVVVGLATAFLSPRKLNL